MDHVEILDLETNTGKRCPNYALKVSAATGGLIGSSPLICGGEPTTDACYIIGQQETVAVTMTTPRDHAASIVFNGRLFIAGGTLRQNPEKRS